MMKLNLVFLSVLVAVCHSANLVRREPQFCQENVPAVKDFDFKQFYGLWYEVGKIQTPEGAAFQKGCRCTAATNKYPANPESPSDVDTEFSCRLWRPNGKYSNVSALLTDMDPPGNYTQTYFPGLPFENKSLFTVIDQGFDEEGNEYRLVYVCNPVDYCVHFFSRNPRLSRGTVMKLIDKAERMGLNPFNVKYEKINHNRCW